MWTASAAPDDNHRQPPVRFRSDEPALDAPGAGFVAGHAERAPLLPALNVLGIVPPMRISELEVSRLAELVIRALLRQGFVKAKVDDKQLVVRIRRLILDNLRVEEEIELEAEQLAQKLGRQALGMDQHKIVQGIKARLAKERGFTL